MAIKAAPKVEKAEAQAAKPKEAPIAEAPVESSTVVVDKPSHAGAAYADLPTERGSCMSESVTPFSQSIKDNSKLSVDELRSCHTIVFESQAAVIIGPADKSICKRILPLLFDERDFLSYGEVKRYILVTTNSTIFVYADVTDPSPLYIIELKDLIPMKEDSNHPDFYSHTISPESNTGLPFQNKSKESLDSVLLKRREGTKDKIAFQFAFDKNEAGKNASDEFVAAVSNATKDVKV